MSHQSLDLPNLLRKKGYRMTMQRQLVLDAVCEAGGHATPDEIYEIVRRSSQAVNRTTVYRTLSLLHSLDLVSATSSDGGHYSYEIAAPQPHHHLVCRNCGADLEVPNDLAVPFFERVQQEFDFLVVTSHLTLHGYCPECVEE